MKKNKGDTFTFNQSKSFKFIQKLGQGGTGETNLFLDEAMNTYFAIKKYSPIGKNIDDKEKNYDRFLDEIKILFTISHPNIVRIYNYYLYPKYITGFIQMEYVNGNELDIYIENNPDEFDRIFFEAINAFVFLEKNNIYHRDIRSSNFLITESGGLKIIDFGFGKMVQSDGEENSILLNWPVDNLPNEVKYNGDYTTKTEIFFLGCLFNNLINKYKISSSDNVEIINKMTEVDPENRYQSFISVNDDLLSKGMLSVNFNSKSKKIYLEFAELLEHVIKLMTNEYNFNYEIDIIIQKLEILLEKNILEEYIQNNGELIQIFINNSFKYTTQRIVPVSVVREFYILLLENKSREREIIIKNIFSRLERIEVEIEPPVVIDIDDLPF